jgi:hypothetical protein
MERINSVFEAAVAASDTIELTGLKTDSYIDGIKKN